MAQFGGGGGGGFGGSSGSSSGGSSLGGSSSGGLSSGTRDSLPGLPVTPPPVDHPALLGQPLMNRDNESRPAPSPSPAPMPGCEPPRPSDPDTFGAKVAGKEMKKAVAAVKKLSWFEDLADAKAMSAATGKPILWLQALGDIDGFA